MDCRGRRGRKGRGRSCANYGNPPPNTCCPTPQCSKSWKFLNSFCSFLILTSLIGIIYLMLDYHCSSCNSKCDLNNINKSIEDIAKNLVLMKNSYNDLELKISLFSKELPKLEGQIEILEALANAIEGKDPGWDPKTHMALPNVDVFLNKPPCEVGKNVSKCKCPKRIPKPITVN